MPRVAHAPTRRREFQKSRAVVLAVIAAERFKRRRVEPQGSFLEALLAGLYVGAGVLFVVGSVCFLPTYATTYYREGVWSYFVGGLIYLKCSLFDLEEARNAGSTFEAAMNLMYVAGTLFYLVATVLFWPEIDSELWGTYSTASSSARCSSSSPASLTEPTPETPSRGLFLPATTTRTRESF